MDASTWTLQSGQTSSPMMSSVRECSALAETTAIFGRLPYRCSPRQLPFSGGCHIRRSTTIPGRMRRSHIWQHTRTCGGNRGVHSRNTVSRRRRAAELEPASLVRRTSPFVYAIKLIAMVPRSMCLCRPQTSRLARACRNERDLIAFAHMQKL